MAAADHMMLRGEDGKDVIVKDDDARVVITGVDAKGKSMTATTSEVGAVVAEAKQARREYREFG